MKNLLVPTDFSENSWNALEYAIGLFKDEVCNFYILHVGHLRESSVSGNNFVLPKENLHLSAKEKLSELYERIKKLNTNENHEFIAVQEYGNFIDMVRRTVVNKKIHLIAMGTKGASGLKATIIGSNTGDVITKVACNVLVIPEKAKIELPKKIAFLTDYTIFYSYPILESITEILKICDAKLQVFDVLLSNSRLTSLQEKNKIYLKDYLEETFLNTHDFLTANDKDLKRAIHNFLKINDLDMVIMVAKNLNFLQNMLFDTTIKKISFHTTVPLLVLHD